MQFIYKIIICKKIFHSKNYSLSLSFFLLSSFRSLPSLLFAREARRVSCIFICISRDRNKYENTRAEDKRHDESTSLTDNAYPPMRYPRHIPRSFLTGTIANVIGNASRVPRDSRSSELNALGDSALGQPIASTTSLLAEPMPDRTLSRLYLPVCAHLASVDPASGR